MSIDEITPLLERLDRIEAALEALVRQRTIKDWYDIADFAALVGKSEFTCREWCRHGRVHAAKRRSGRGRTQEWVVSHEELLRFQKEGLLPFARAT
jgi:hypothetical protein